MVGLQPRNRRSTFPNCTTSCWDDERKNKDKESESDAKRRVENAILVQEG